MKYKDEVFKIIKSKTNKSFDENTQIRDLGLDSIDMIEMITDLEEELKIEVPTDKINSIKTISDFLVILNNL